jgi:hypothetical protein
VRLPVREVPTRAARLWLRRVENRSQGPALKLPVALRPCKISRPNMAAQKTNTTTKPSKSEFIREQPSAMSAADVIAKGKGEGITLSTDLVYGVRSRARLKKATKGAAKKTAAKKGHATKPAQMPKAVLVRKLPAAFAKVRASAKTDKATKKAETRTATPRRGGAVARPIATTSSAEELFRAVAAEIGLARAMEILAGERARVRAVIGG